MRSSSNGHKRQPKRAPKRKPPKAKNDAPAWVEPYDSDNPLDGYTLSGVEGIPALLDAPPTTLIVVHGAFTARHVIGELRYHWEVGNLQPGDLQQLAQLGKEITEELERTR